jgi:hypothetical protein
MSFARAVIIASIWLGATAASAQPRDAVPAAAQPPLFQSVMVDAKGKTIGRYVFSGLYSSNGIGGFSAFVVRQISGIWVMIPVGDFKTGFVSADISTDAIQFFYQSTDCTGTPYLEVNVHAEVAGNAHYATAPALGQVATVPPATAPSIYFAGAPSLLTFQSFRYIGQTCGSLGTGGYSDYAGPAQVFPVSSLGLTLPFSIK